MKKTILALLIALSVLFVPIYAFAEEETAEETPSVDYGEVAKEIYEKFKDELPEEAIENLAALLDQWDATDKEDATFKDRLSEFFKPENLVNTVSMIFLVIVGLFLYIMKHKQGLSIKSTNDDLRLLKNELEEQKKAGKGVGESVANLESAVDKVTELLGILERKLDDKNDLTEQTKLAAIGVATMLKDIFQNSRTIDEAGKKIMNLDYLKAIGEAIEETEKEEKDEGV